MIPIKSWKHAIVIAFMKCKPSPEQNNLKSSRHHEQGNTSNRAKWHTPAIRSDLELLKKLLATYQKEQWNTQNSR
jgi:hypothetical protein